MKLCLECHTGVPQDEAVSCPTCGGGSWSKPIAETAPEAQGREPGSPVPAREHMPAREPPTPPELTPEPPTPYPPVRSSKRSAPSGKGS